MFFVGILLIWTLVHVYVVRAAGSIPLIAHRVPLWLRILAAALLGSSFLLARLVNRLSPAASRPLEFLGAYWIGVLFLLFFTLLAADLLTAFGYFCPRRVAQFRGAAFLFALALAAIAILQGSRAPAVREFEVSMAGLPAEQDGTVVVFVSDMHVGSTLDGHWLEARVAQIQALHPDLILLGGDIIEGDDPAERGLLPIFARLSAPLGVWAVTGNHEMHFGRLAGPQSVLDHAGLAVLHDRWHELRPGLVLAGVDDLTSRRRLGDTSIFVTRALAARPPGALILVSHTPWNAETAARSGAGLMLSGHTHGGQIWPFGYVVRATYPLFAGRYEVEGMTVIVGRGTGTWGPRMRLWRRAEILRITLRSPAAQAQAAAKP